MFGHDDPEGMTVGKQKKKAKTEQKKHWFKVEDAIYFKVISQLLFLDDLIQVATNIFSMP